MNLYAADLSGCTQQESGNSLALLAMIKWSLFPFISAVIVDALVNPDCDPIPIITKSFF